MAADQPAEARIFSYEEAVALLPEVRHLTELAFRRVESLQREAEAAGAAAKDLEQRLNGIVNEWAQALIGRGVEVKGLWLADFDNGSGYYCWRYPERSLQYYHSYEDGFQGRMRIQ
jgi:hypothetical protein